MFVLAAVLVAAGLASIGSEFPHLTVPLLSAGAVFAFLGMMVRPRRVSRR